MKIGLVGPSYQMRSLPFDAQRTINLFPVIDEQGKEVASLYGTPGLSLFGSVNFGAGRRCFSSANGRAFVFIGSKFYEIDANGDETERGSLYQTNGNLSVCENNTQMAICDGTRIYIFTYSTNSFVVVSSGLPSVVVYVCSIDGYFVAVEGDSGRFFISNLSDGLVWDSLDFATAESSPDDLLAAANAGGNLFLLGSRTYEIWNNVGGGVFPFQRISGAVGDVGILAPHTAVDVDSSLIWVGGDKNGKGIVYRTQGFRPQRISTEAIEIIIQSATNPDDMRSYVYQKDGHNFYIITGGGLSTSLCYDFSTQLWHERAHLNDQGEFEQHLAADCMFSFGKHICVDRVNPLIYELSPDTYSDNGETIARERIFTHIGDEGREIRYNKLELGFETGIGLQSGQGSNPLVSLQLSKDGARTWSDWYTAEIGAAGQYKTKVSFRRLGIADQMTIKIRITDPVKVAITGSYLS